MAQRDKIHNAVKSALINDGWTITDDPYTIEYEDTVLQADLGAERPIAAEQNGRKIVVEIKSFLGPSFMRDLELALGQYQVYLSFLEITAPDRQLYLALSERIYTKFFTANRCKESSNAISLLCWWWTSKPKRLCYGQNDQVSRVDQTLIDRASGNLQSPSASRRGAVTGDR